MENTNEWLAEIFSEDMPFVDAFKCLFENARDAVYILDKQGNFVIVNSKAEELTGFKREDFIGKSFRKIIPFKSLPKAIRGFVDVVRGKEIRLELKIKTATKNTVLAEVTSRPLRIKGKIVGTFGIVREITEQEKALQKSEERFRILMEEAPIGICNTDLKGKITYVNKKFEEATGYAREEIVGRDGFKLDIMSDETLKLLAKRTKERLMGKPSRLLECQFKRKDGEWIWAEVEGTLIKKFGIPVGFQLTARDITERKKTEEERKRFEERLSALHTYSRDLNLAESMEEIYRLTLDAMEKTLGFEIAFFMVVDKNMLCMVDHRGYPEPFSIKLPLDGTKGVSVKVAKTGRPINVPDATKEEAWVEFMPSIRSGLDVPVKLGGKVLGVIGVDSKKLNAFNQKDQELLEILASHAATAISNLDRAKSLEAYAQEIRESQQKFERLFMDNPEAAIYMDSGFHILDVNPRFCELFGYSLSEVKGRHINDVIVPKDKIEEGEMLDRDALKKGYVYHDTVRKRKDGSLVPVSISAAPIAVEGKLFGTVGLYRDITERRQMEKKLEEYSQRLEELVEERTRQLKEAQEQLIKSERLAAIGQVAAMVGHDLRNPLTSIKGATYYLKKKLASKMDEEAREMLGLIEKDVEHSNEIITELMEYSKVIRLELTEIAPKSIVKEALSLVEVPENVKVLNLTQSEPKITMDVEKMKRVFGNLVKNAIDAMPNGGKLTITSHESDGNVKIAFADVGIGMTKEIMEKVWTPFFTTKAKGMGLGLPICKRIIEAHEGSISVESTASKGTTFTIIVPIKSKIEERGEKVWVNVPESLSSTTTKA